MSAVSSCRANSCWASRPALVSGLIAASAMADNPPTVPGYFRPISRQRLARRSFVARLIGSCCRLPFRSDRGIFPNVRRLAKPDEPVRDPHQDHYTNDPRKYNSPLAAFPIREHARPSVGVSVGRALCSDRRSCRILIRWPNAIICLR